MKVKKVTAEDIRRKSYKRDKKTLSDKRTQNFDEDEWGYKEKHVRGFIDRYLDKLWKKRYCKSEEGFERWEEIVNTLIEEAGEELIK